MIDSEITHVEVRACGSNPKLKTLHEGWRFESNVLDRDLVLDMTLSNGCASIIRDELHCTHPAGGYDKEASANYIL